MGKSQKSITIEDVFLDEDLSENEQWEYSLE
jgi:hypothetical protein